MFKVADPVHQGGAGGGHQGTGGGGTLPTINSPRVHINSDKQNTRPIQDIRSFQTGLDRSLDGDKFSRRNGLVKQEASTMSSSVHLSASALLIYLLAFLCSVRT